MSTRIKRTETKYAHQTPTVSQLFKIGSLVIEPHLKRKLLKDEENIKNSNEQAKLNLIRAIIGTKEEEYNEAYKEYKKTKPDQDDWKSILDWFKMPSKNQTYITTFLPDFLSRERKSRTLSGLWMNDSRTATAARLGVATTTLYFGWCAIVFSQKPVFEMRSKCVDAFENCAY